MPLTAEVSEPVADRSRTHAPASGELDVGRETVLSHQHADYFAPGVFLGQFGAKFAKFAKLRLAASRVF